MARGWESKSVESQQQEAEAGGNAPRRSVTREDADRLHERTALMMARTRALSDLQRACVPGHRAMLEQAIADLDKRIAALAVTPS